MSHDKLVQEAQNGDREVYEARHDRDVFQKAARKLERENADLKRINKILHDAYMDIRKEVNAFDTKPGGVDRFAVTLEKVRDHRRRLERGHVRSCRCYDSGEDLIMGYLETYIDPRCIALREGK